MEAASSGRRTGRADGLQEALLRAAHTGLAHFLGAPDIRRPAAERLAFRELGLAIGLAALARLATSATSLKRGVAGVLSALERYLPLRGEILPPCQARSRQVKNLPHCDAHHDHTACRLARDALRAHRRRTG